MLTLSHVANLMALLLGERPETMQLIARNLRQAKLVASGGRGRGGARQAPQHVANMIIAACASDQVAEVAGAVATFSNLELGPSWSPRKRTSLGGDHDRPKELLFATRRSAKFGAVLAELVNMAASGDLYTLLMSHATDFIDRDILRAGADAIRQAPRNKKPEATAAFAMQMAAHVQALIDQSRVYLTISFQRPLPSAQIEFGTQGEGHPTALFRAEFGLPAGFVAKPRNVPRLAAWGRIDRSHRVTVSHRTLLAIGQAIAAEEAA